MPKIIIYKNNIEQYLLNQLIPTLAIKEIISSREIKNGNSNHIFSVKINDGKKNISIIVKQARNDVKRKSLGQSSQLDPKRLFYESEILKFLQTIWDCSTIPQVYYLDKLNHISIMEDISQGSILLSEELKKNNIHPELAVKFAKLFSKLHWDTLHNIPTLPYKKGYITQILNYRLKYLEAIKKYSIYNTARQVYIDALKITPCFCWHDPVPRNIFINKKGVIHLIDFESAMPYDPAWDIAIFLSSWCIKLCEDSSKNVYNQIGVFVSDFMKEYQPRSMSNDSFLQIKQRILKFLGIYFLSRIEGPYGSYYKNEPETENKIRQSSLALIKPKSEPIADKIRTLI